MQQQAKTVLTAPEPRDAAGRTNHALRETVRREKRLHPGGPTAVSCCGANPGTVSWFVEAALLDIARDTGANAAMPDGRDGWARLKQSLGIKGIHIAERDTQTPGQPKPLANA